MSVYTNSGGTSSVSSVFYYVKDRLGSIESIVDVSGAVVESYGYDAWGNILEVRDGNGNLSLEANGQWRSGIGNRYLWQGREYSWKTGLYYFRARWYDPVTGRWLSNDPIGISGGLNQYVFCGDDPVNKRDPLGLCDREPNWWKAIKEALKTLLERIMTWPPDILNPEMMRDLLSTANTITNRAAMVKDVFNNLPTNGGGY